MRYHYSMKTINAAKLEAMGIERVQKTCVFHAHIAVLEGRPGGNKQRLERHCDQPGQSKHLEK